MDGKELRRIVPETRLSQQRFTCGVSMPSNEGFRPS